MSPQQLKQLGIAASAAIKHQRMVKALSAETMPPDLRGASASAQNEFWRHQQVAVVTQRVCSFKEMRDLRAQGGPDEYTLMMQHFEALAGPFWKGRAVKRTVKVIDGADCDRAPGCEYVRDMRHWMSKAGIHESYCLPIMKRWRADDIRALRTWQLKQLHDTVVNRCRAKLGLGEAANRNKKQRHQSGEQRAKGEEPQPQTLQAAEGVPAPAKAREYILKPRAPRPAHYVPNPEIEPF